MFSQSSAFSPPIVTDGADVARSVRFGQLCREEMQVVASRARG